MGYLAENLVYFMAEAVDRNGKKDPSLGMKHADDFVKKTKDERRNAIRNNNKALMHMAKVDSKADDDSFANAHNKINAHPLHNTRKEHTPDNYFALSAKDDFYNNTNARKDANISATKISSTTKLMRRDAKKAHNESALFNDPIWDEL